MISQSFESFRRRAIISALTLPLIAGGCDRENETVSEPEQPGNKVSHDLASLNIRTNLSRRDSFDLVRTHRREREMKIDNLDGDSLIKMKFDEVLDPILGAKFANRQPDFNQLLQKDRALSSIELFLTEGSGLLSPEEIKSIAKFAGALAAVPQLRSLLKLDIDFLLCRTSVDSEGDRLCVEILKELNSKSTLLQIARFHSDETIVKDVIAFLSITSPEMAQWLNADRQKFSSQTKAVREMHGLTASLDEALIAVEDSSEMLLKFQAELERVKEELVTKSKAFEDEARAARKTEEDLKTKIEQQDRRDLLEVGGRTYRIRRVVSAIDVSTASLILVKKGDGLQVPMIEGETYAVIWDEPYAMTISADLFGKSHLVPIAENIGSGSLLPSQCYGEKLIFSAIPYERPQTGELRLIFPEREFKVNVRLVAIESADKKELNLPDPSREYKSLEAEAQRNAKRRQSGPRVVGGGKNS